METKDAKSLNLEQERAVVLGASGVFWLGCPQKQGLRKGLGCLLVITRNGCVRVECMRKDWDKSKECAIRVHQVPAVEDGPSEEQAWGLSGGLSKGHAAGTLVHRLLPLRR